MTDISKLPCPSCEEYIIQKISEIHCIKCNVVLLYESFLDYFLIQILDSNLDFSRKFSSIYVNRSHECSTIVMYHQFENFNFQIDLCAHYTQESAKNAYQILKSYHDNPHLL